MLEDVKKIVKQSAIYGLSRISTKLVGLVLLPIYTLNFSVAEYGVIGRLETLWQILWALQLFGLESGLVRWYSEITDPVRRKKFLFSIIGFLLIYNGIFFFLTYYFSFQISTGIFDEGIYSNLVLYTSLIAISEVFIFVVFLIIRIQEKPLMYSLFSILLALLNLIIQYYYIQFTTSKLEGVFLAKIFAPVIILAFLLPYFLKFLRIGFEASLIKDILYYSFPLMLGSIVSTLLNQSDRYFLGYLSNDTSVGIYVLGYNVSGLISFLIVAPFSLAFSVLSWKKLNDPEARRFYTKTATYVYYTVLYVALILSLMVPHFIKIFALNTNYWPAKDIVPWIALSMPLYGIHFVAVFSFYVTKKTNFTLYAYLTALIVKAGLNVLLIPVWDIYGAAVANYLSFLTLVLFLYIFSKKEYFIPFEWLKFVYMTIICIIFMLPFFYFEFEYRALQYVLEVLAILTYPFILYIFKIYEPNEIRVFKDYFRRFLRYQKS